MPLPDCVEPRPLDGWSAAEPDEEGEAGELALEVAPVDAVLDDGFVAADVPGMVAPLTTAKTPTPANAPMAAPAVSRLRRRMASSRERILA